ncbi:hypothetical protein ACTXT7_001031 [Hymenolepis weldensis]
MSNSLVAETFCICQNLTAAKDATRNVPEFIYDPKSEAEFYRIFGTLTEEQYRCLIFISGIKTRPLLPPRTPLSKRMEKNPNVTLKVMVKEDVKMADLMRDSALTDSDALPTRLCMKCLHLCLSQHNLWHNQILMSNKNRLHIFNAV